MYLTACQQAHSGGDNWYVCHLRAGVAPDADGPGAQHPYPQAVLGLSS